MPLPLSHFLLPVRDTTAILVSRSQTTASTISECYTYSRVWNYTPSKAKKGSCRLIVSSVHEKSSLDFIIFRFHFRISISNKQQAIQAKLCHSKDEMEAEKALYPRVMFRASVEPDYMTEAFENCETAWLMRLRPSCLVSLALHFLKLENIVCFSFFSFCG